MSLKSISNENIFKEYDGNHKATYESLLKRYDANLLSLYFKYNYDYNYEETQENKIRRYQDKFRRDLIDRYKSCVITGNDIEMCDAAHILPFSESDLVSKYDVDNGLLLSGEMHKLFDRKHLKINPDTLCIEFSEKMLQNKNNNCNQYHGTKLRSELNDNTKSYLKQVY